MSYISKWRLQNNSVVPVGSNLFGTCNSGSSDTTKVVSLSAFNVLVEGVTIHVYFANANSGSNTLLQVGSTSAQPIKRNGVAEGKWESGSVISFTYSQGYWVQNDADVGSGGGGETYTLSKSGDTITLTGSGGDTSSVIDDNTTYAIAVNGYQIVLTDSDGYSQRVTLPSGMYIVDDSNTLDEICGAYNDERVIYYQYWANAYTLRFLPLAEIDCSDHALFAQIINDGTDTYLLIAMVDENDDWSTSAIPIETTDTTYTISISGNDITLTPSSGTAQTITLPIPTKTSDLTNDSGFITGMEILSYGHSTWNDFITAYDANKIVYCRASSNSNPATGSQTRLAFMAYVNNATTPTEVEFQYYRSIATHSANQQGDQVFVYKLNETNGWSVTTREAATKIVASTGLQQTYSNGTLTITAPHDTTKQDVLVSGTNIKTINGNSILGSGDLTTPDDDTTYSISISGNTLTLTGSDGSTVPITLPDDDTTYTFSISGNTLTITDSDGNTQTITLPSGGGEHIELTQVQYNALPQSEKDDPNKVYFITDGTPFPQSFIDAIYPVGSIYQTTDDSFDPNTSWGGTWVLIEEGRFLQATETSATGGDTVSAGLPNISGNMIQRSTNYQTSNITWGGSNSLFQVVADSGTADGVTQANGALARKNITFDASRINSIYGNSTTVQPPSVKVYMWHRTA